MVLVRLRHPGRLYHFEAGTLDLAPGDWVVVETARGRDLGQVVLPPAELPEDELPEELKPVLRPAGEADFRRAERFYAKEPEVLERTRALVEERGLPMRLVTAEYTCDGRLLTIYFTADKRVDFRELVKDLAREFHTRIELRQIGARDEARLLGGIGICGRPLCCATFLHDALRISVRMAKDQDLPLSPMKISGVCGRLLCCLSYEWEQYREIKSQLPAVGEEVVTPQGRGVVTAVNVPKETVSVELRPGITVEVAARDLLGREPGGGVPSSPLPVCERLSAEEGLGVLEEEEGELVTVVAEEGPAPEPRKRRRRRKRRRSEGMTTGPTAEQAPAPAAPPSSPGWPSGAPEPTSPKPPARRRPRRRPPPAPARSS
ncbi:MAG: PSP1 domain-containing protein [Chloroflexia bacterium]